MFKFDQIAIRTSNINRSIDSLTLQGHTNWVRDTVFASHLFVRGGLNLGFNFEVHLAFNYEIFEGQEFELIQLVNGKTIQLADGRRDILSHFGYHIQDQDAKFPDDHDTLVRELHHLRDRGLEVLQVSQTETHQNTGRRYRYAFAYHPEVGAPIKIIQRLLPVKDNAASVAQGKEMFKWLQ